MSTVTWTIRNRPESKSLLQQEDKFYILLESGFRIIIQSTSYTDRTGVSADYTDRTGINASYTDRTVINVDLEP